MQNAEFLEAVEIYKDGSVSEVGRIVGRLVCEVVEVRRFSSSHGWGIVNGGGLRYCDGRETET